MFAGDYQHVSSTRARMQAHRDAPDNIVAVSSNGPLFACTRVKHHDTCAPAGTLRQHSVLHGLCQLFCSRIE